MCHEDSHNRNHGTRRFSGVSWALRGDHSEDGKGWYVELHIDTYHMNIEEADIGAAIGAAGGYIGHVHLADSDRWYPGHGHYDFQETFQALKDIGYDGPVAIECSNFPNEDVCGEKGLEYVTGILSELL